MQNKCDSSPPRYKTDYFLPWIYKLTRFHIHPPLNFFNVPKSLKVKFNYFFIGPKLKFECFFIIGYLWLNAVSRTKTRMNSYNRLTRFSYCASVTTRKISGAGNLSESMTATAPGSSQDDQFWHSQTVKMLACHSRRKCISVSPSKLLCRRVTISSHPKLKQ